MTMFLKIFLFFSLLSIGSSVEAEQNWQVTPLKSSISFLVHSTLHEFNGQAGELFGNFDRQQKMIKGFIDVGVTGLSTNNPDRDKAMYRMFDASQYSQIQFNFEDTDLSQVLDRHIGDVIFNGKLTIHHVTRPVTILSQGSMQDGVLVCEGKMLINLKDYDLKPPSILGLIRVNDEVLVHFRIVFVPKEDPYAS